ncbi:MAG: glycosyltransferase [Actinobacteria bacterium]|nr:MAG: glycosyltransferase [Actinomycetota bacterium]
MIKEETAKSVNVKLIKTTKKITLIIPCYNEAKGIGSVIEGLPRNKLKTEGYEVEVIVIDNNSTDDTAAIASAWGAQVVHEHKKGKGSAIRAGFYAVSPDTDYVVMIDGDNTYKTQEILRLIEPLESGFCDAVMGSRLAGKMNDHSMRAFNRLGNWIFSALVRNFYRLNITDTLTGYFAWRYEVVEKMRPYITSNGFSIEMEMIAKQAKLGFETYSVPITYDPRAGNSNLEPIKDGFRILSMFFKQLRWNKPAKKIAFVSDAVYPFHVGGKEKRLYEIARRLVRDDRQIDIYTMQWWEGGKTIEIEGITYHGISRLYPMYVNERRSIKEGIMFSLACFKLLFKSFDLVDVDHMPFFPLFSMRVVCWLKRKKLYATWHEVWGCNYWRQYLGYLGFIGYLIEKISTKIPNVIIANSEHTTKRLKDTGVKCKVKSVPLGVDLDHIYDAPINPESSDIIYAGRLLNHKNVDLLIRAIKVVKAARPDVKCTIIGNGPEKTLLVHLVKSLGLTKNVQLIGFLEKADDVYGYIKASKVLVLPSVREGFGLIVAEANACNIPVVTTNHEDNAARDLIIEGENGYLSEVDTVHLAKQIIRVLDEKNNLKPLETFKNKFGSFRWERVVADFEKMLVAK